MRRRRRGQFVLRLAVWTLGILVVLGAAGLAADHWRPHWLTSLHIPGVHTTGDTSTPTTTSSHTSSTAPPDLQRGTTSPTAVTVTVRAPRSPSWSPPTAAELGGGDRARPLRGHLRRHHAAGAVQKFPVTTGLTLQIGSASGRTLVTVDNKVVGFYFPKAAPTTITYVRAPDPQSPFSATTAATSANALSVVEVHDPHAGGVAALGGDLAHRRADDHAAGRNEEDLLVEASP